MDFILRNIEPHFIKVGLGTTKVDFIPGARISDISKKVSKLMVGLALKRLVLNIGSNNISSAKNPNQVVRPLW